MAYNLAGMLAHVTKGEDLRVLLVDAEGYVSRRILPGVALKPADGLVSDSGGDLNDYLIHDTNSGLRALLRPERDAAPEPKVAGLIDRLRSEFDALVVACGDSEYATAWLRAADEVVVSGAGSDGLGEAAERVERLADRGGVLLAPMGRAESPDELGDRRLFELPSRENEAFEKAEKTGEFATSVDASVGRSFRPLLEELLGVTEGLPEGPFAAPDGAAAARGGRWGARRTDRRTAAGVSEKVVGAARRYRYPLVVGVAAGVAAVLLLTLAPVVGLFGGGYVAEVRDTGLVVHALEGGKDGTKLTIGEQTWQGKIETKGDGEKITTLRGPTAAQFKEGFELPGEGAVTTGVFAVAEPGGPLVHATFHRLDAEGGEKTSGSYYVVDEGEVLVEGHYADEREGGKVIRSYTERTNDGEERDYRVSFEAAEGVPIPQLVGWEPPDPDGGGGER